MTHVRNFRRKRRGRRGTFPAARFLRFRLYVFAHEIGQRRDPAVPSVGQAFSRLLEITKLLKRERKFFCSREEKELDKSTVLLLISLYISNISMCSLNF